MAEERTIFLCRSCKPVSNISKPSTRHSTVEAYSYSDFKSSFKYNLKSNIDKQHGGNNIPIVQTEQQQDKNRETEVKMQEEIMMETTMEDFQL